MHGLNLVLIVCRAIDLEYDLSGFNIERGYWCEHRQNKKNEEKMNSSYKIIIG